MPIIIVNGRTIRMNMDVDPTMIGMEYAHTKQGAHLERAARLRSHKMARRDLEHADSLGQLSMRHAADMPRRTDQRAS